jgi:prepilin-type N-terminal cleavage/methylation domain-containing protein
MMQYKVASRSNRIGFTLIELLVAVVLLLVLAGLAIMVIPSANDSQATVNAATNLQQWIEIAKQRAARDRAPRGIRLLLGQAPVNATLPASNPTGVPSGGLVVVTNMVYIEQPDNYDMGFTAFPASLNTTAGLMRESTATVTNVTRTTGQVYTLVTFANTNRTLTGGAGVAAALYPVQPGDYLQLNGVSYQINLVHPPATYSSSASGMPHLTNAQRMVSLTLATSATTNPTPPYAVAGLTAMPPPPNVTTTNYRIIRQPRPIGDDQLEMPINIAIDLTPRYIQGTIHSASPVPGPWDLPTPTATTPWLDILFSPDGKVMSTPTNNLAVYDKIILWVRDLTVPDGANDPTLVVIYPRTGLIASYDVDSSNTNLQTAPYTFTTTGVK